MLSGPLFLLPGFLRNYFDADSDERNAQLNRRVIASGCLFFIICMACFTNIPALSDQLERHLYASDKIITPNHTLVLNLKNTFFQGVNPDTFKIMSFEEKMLAVDTFILSTIN